MEDKIKLSIFPDDRFATLTILYLEKQDFTGQTPEQFLDKYDEVYGKIRLHYQKTRADRRNVE